MIDKSLKQHYEVTASKKKKIKGEWHKLAYITPKEAKLLQKSGGVETRTPEGLFAYPGGAGTPGGYGGGPSGPSGPSGPPGGGDRQMSYSAPAPSPHRPDPVPTRVVTTAKAPPSILSKGPLEDTRGDTPDKLIEQIILDEIRKKEKEQFERDQDYMDLKAKAPKTWAPPKKTYERGTPFTDDLIETVTPPKYSPTYYQDRSKIGGETYGERAEDMMPRGGIMSTIGGGLKKIGKTIFGDNPFDIAMNLLTLGGYEKAKYAKMILNARKTGTLSNKTLEKAKSIYQSTFDEQKKAKGQLTSAQGLTTSQKIAGGKGLESGAELLGLKGTEGQQAKFTGGKSMMEDFYANEPSWSKRVGDQLGTNLQTVGMNQDQLDAINKLHKRNLDVDEGTTNFFEWHPQKKQVEDFVKNIKKRDETKLFSDTPKDIVYGDPTTGATTQEIQDYINSLSNVHGPIKNQNPSGYAKKNLIGVAKGGRIDKPFPGRSRDI